jgi:SAM-dependent methyltransferase
MNIKSTWETFFDAHAPAYDGNVFTKNTSAEVDFLLDELKLPAGAAILDVGCGTGRHSIELARRGYAMTGLDLSSEMLARAVAAAKAAAVSVAWIHADAARFALPEKYDAAICLCEGSIGLLGQADDPIAQPLAILCNISRSLKPQARVMATVLSAARMLRAHTDTDVEAGRFDPLSLMESSEIAPREGHPAIAVRERGFTGPELRLLFHLAGLPVVHAWGGTAGHWGRRNLELDEYEIMVVAQKTGEPSDAGVEMVQAALPSR